MAKSGHLDLALLDPRIALRFIRAALLSETARVGQGIYDHPPFLVRYAASGVVRVVGVASSFRGFIDVAFHQIRQAGATHPAVIIQMLSTIARLAANVRLSSHRDALFDHAVIIAEAGRREASEASDIADIELAYEAAKIALK